MKKQKRKKYTVSDKVLEARRAYGKSRRGTGKTWVTCKVTLENQIWAKHTFGSVNAALETTKTTKNK